jgi:endonuclease G
MMRRFLSPLALATLLLTASCAKNTPSPLTSANSSSSTGSTSAVATRDNNLALGNPSGAVTNATTSANNYLLSRPQYVMSYNRAQGKPNWVSWHLSSAWLGSTQRQDNFGPDPLLPNTWFRATSSSYSGSGFDRGHNCPSGDRTGSTVDNSATFLMSNMMPQAPRNNQVCWEGLESYSRTLAGRGNELYIICGSYGQGGTGSNGTVNTLASGNITVPSNCWKVVVVLPNGTGDAARITSNTRVIAINTPNTQTVGANWGDYRTSVDAIEAATGYDLLSALPLAVQNVIESRVDAGPTI